MTRSSSDRARDVRRLVDAARAVAADRARIAPAIARDTGLSPEGVELGFARHIELDAADDEIAALVARAGDAPCVHVVLSANVFTAPLRAIAVARAASARVVVRPSRRDPTFARALVEAARDPAITLVDAIDFSSVEGELHVYGRDATIADIAARVARGVVVRGHGAGMGVAIVARTEPELAARALAEDVVAFDQRGCLSPRVAIVASNDARAFAVALDRALAEAARAIPRGVLADDERADAARWADAAAFAGELFRGEAHAVALGPLALPSPGRHVQVVAAMAADVASVLAPIARHVVAIGTDDPALAAGIPHARISAIGAMQRPRLDGPVDLRTQTS